MFSCKSLPDNPPIPISKMSKVILDMQIAEIYSQGLGDSVKNKYEKNYDSLNAFYISILKHHNISFEDYNNAINWYKNHPILMDSIFASVSKDLALVRKTDSIKDVPLSTANPYTGKPKTDSVVKTTEGEKKKDSLNRPAGLKKLSLDTITKDGKNSKKQLKPLIKDTTTFHKKPAIKREL